MEIKVTFKIKTRLSDADIKDSILNNDNWSFVKEDDVNVWSPVSILPTDILPAQEIKNFPHVTFIDICHDPDFQDFDELAAFIENKFDESEERFYDRGWFNDPDIPLSIGDFDDKTHTEKMKKPEPKEHDMYCFTIEHVKKGITLKKIKEIVSEKLKEEHAILSSVFETLPSSESVNVFRYGNDGASVYIMANYRFFEWLNFGNLKTLIKEKIEKPEEKTNCESSGQRCPYCHEIFTEKIEKRNSEPSFMTVCPNCGWVVVALK